MEELLSTETLDQEILEDAREKAYGILKAADETLEAGKRDLETRIQKTLDEIRDSYAKRAGKSRDEILARLPLDKRRLRSETIESFLVRAMDDFLRSLSREKLLGILADELSRRLGVCAAEPEAFRETKPKVLYSGLGLSELRGVFEKIRFEKNRGAPEEFWGKADFGFLSAVRAEDWDFKEDSQNHEFPSVVIDTGVMKISVSVEDAAGTLMQEKRAELAAALLGEGALND